jgi:hypothetical protein
VKQEIAKQWCEALRSGKYKQGKGALRCGDSFCCLGVLCDIGNLPDWRERCTLPKHIREWSGMQSKDGTYRYDHNHTATLAWLNDEESKTFAEIADIIEKNWEDL